MCRGFAVKLKKKKKKHEIYEIKSLNKIAAVFHVFFSCIFILRGSMG